MAGKIEYSLGLATAGFLGPLRSVTAGLAGFIGLAGGLGGAVAGVFNEINRGGALKDLSNRTGELVGDLFQLQFAFQQSGVSAASLPTVLQKYRAALSGVGEMGESTAEAFSLIGTNIEDLKKLDAPAALDAIFGGLNKLDRNTAAGVAAKIFGRGASGDILQLARDAEGFARALKEAASQAAVMDRMAGVFDDIGDRLGEIRLQMRGVFLGIAADIAPAINGLLTTLANRDFAMLGKIAELSLTVAFEKSLDFLANGFVKLFAALPRMIFAAFQVGVAANAAVAAPLVKALGPHFGAALGLVPGGPMVNALTKDKQVGGANFLSDVLKIAAGDAMKQAGENIVKGFESGAGVEKFSLFGGANAAALAELLKPFGAVAAGVARGAGGVAASSGFGGDASKLSPANALERVGALFGSGTSSSLTDHARQTAANTRESAKTLYKVSAVLERMERQSTGGFANV